MVNSHILEVRNLTKTFDGIHAVVNLNFNVAKGEIKAIIGPNGAGKTTVIKAITGVYTKGQKEGEIVFKGENITRLKPHEIAHLGISQTFQITNLFRNMTVIENVMSGRHIRSKSNIFTDAFSFPKNRRQEKSIFDSAFEKLEFVGIADKAFSMAGNLPSGEQKLLEIARALALEPELILLDEPAGGMNPFETTKLERIISKIREDGITILLIEHKMDLIMSVSDEIIVLNFGEKIAEGPPDSVANNPAVIKAYLG